MAATLADHRTRRRTLLEFFRRRLYVACHQAGPQHASDYPELEKNAGARQSAEPGGKQGKQ